MILEKKEKSKETLFVYAKKSPTVLRLTSSIPLKESKNTKNIRYTFFELSDFLEI